ncbi:MAG: HEPN domain-containing protein [Crocosphaera sp.]
MLLPRWNIPKINKKTVEKPFLIEIFCQLVSPLIDSKSFDNQLILFKFTNIRKDSNKVLNNWQKRKEELTSIIQLYLRLYYVPVRHTNDLFLNLAKAVEVFHRIYHEGKYCDDETFDKIKEELRKTFQSELIKHNIKEYYHDSLLNKIQYWNEYSLKERLEDLLNDESFYSCLPDNFFSNSEDEHNFVRQVRDTRGRLTHPDSNKSKKKQSNHIVSGKELDQLNFKLRIILEICLLRSLEINSSDILKIIQERYNF